MNVLLVYCGTRSAEATIPTLFCPFVGSGAMPTFRGFSRASPCSGSSVPSSCIAAAQDAGLPDGVIDQMRNPTDLEAGE